MDMDGEATSHSLVHGEGKLSIDKQGKLHLMDTARALCAEVISTAKISDNTMYRIDDQEKWDYYHKHEITSSQLGKLMGFHQRHRLSNVWQYKMNEITGDSKYKETPAVTEFEQMMLDHGTRLEPVAYNFFAEQCEKHPALLKCVPIERVEHSFRFPLITQELWVSPDALVRFADKLVPLEIKCPYKRDIYAGGVPLHYLPQLMSQCLYYGTCTALFFDFKLIQDEMKDEPPKKAGRLHVCRFFQTTLDKFRKHADELIKKLMVERPDPHEINAVNRMMYVYQITNELEKVPGNHRLADERLYNFYKPWCTETFDLV